MKKVLTALAVALVVAVLVAGSAIAQPQPPPTLSGTSGGPHPPLNRAPEATEQLFRGDLLPEIGIGCSNPTGNSGGPNDFAVEVTASLAPPFFVTSTTYNLFTQISPNITALSFVAWANSGSVPGAELGRQTGLPFAPGNHTAPISALPITASPSFFFGLNQPQTNVGLRAGLDTSTTGGATSYIRAPACGAGAFTDLTALGIPGNWVMAAVVNDMIPVELIGFDVE